MIRMWSEGQLQNVGRHPIEEVKKQPEMKQLKVLINNLPDYKHEVPVKMATQANSSKLFSMKKEPRLRVDTSTKFKTGNSVNNSASCL
jgi:hypothetical protein